MNKLPNEILNLHASTLRFIADSSDEAVVEEKTKRGNIPDT